MAKMGRAAVLLIGLLGLRTGSAPTAVWSEHPASFLQSMAHAKVATAASRPGPSSTPAPCSSSMTTRVGAAKGGRPVAKVIMAKEDKVGKAARKPLLQKRSESCKKNVMNCTTCSSSRSRRRKQNREMRDRRSR